MGALIREVGDADFLAIPDELERRRRADRTLIDLIESSARQAVPYIFELMVEKELERRIVVGQVITRVGHDDETYYERT